MLCLNNNEYNIVKSLVQMILVTFVLESATMFQQLMCYKSAFGPILRGIAFNSERMQRNSPQIHMMARQAMFNSHHENAVGKWLLYIQQIMRWTKCAVQEKSKHCFVLCTRNHNPHALKIIKILFLDRNNTTEKCKTCHKADNTYKCCYNHKAEKKKNCHYRLLDDFSFFF